MRILIVTDAFPPRCGGSGWSTHALARGLGEAGHEVRVVQPEPGHSGSRPRDQDGIPVLGVGVPVVDVPVIRTMLREGVVSRRLEEALTREIDERQPAVVHAQHVLSAGPAVAAARRAGIPAVVTVRDYWPICYLTTWHTGGAPCPGCSVRETAACFAGRAPLAGWSAVPLKPYFTRVVQRRQASLRAAAAVIAVSRFVADHAVTPVVGEDRSLVIPNLVDSERMLRDSDPAPSGERPDRFVFFAGKLNRWKGAELLLQALERVEVRLPLVVAGDGPDRGLLAGIARERGLDVRFLPWVENREVLRWMRRATALVVPSLWPEPLSRTLLEGMTVGAPIVATRVGGIDDQIEDGRTGTLCDPTPESLARAIDGVSRDPEAAASRARAAAAVVVERFGVDRVVSETLALYDRVGAGG